MLYAHLVLQFLTNPQSGNILLQADWILIICGLAREAHLDANL